MRKRIHSGSVPLYKFKLVNNSMHNAFGVSPTDETGVDY